MYNIPFVNLQLQYASLFFEEKKKQNKNLTKKEKVEVAKKQNSILNRI